jgi:hypothetical protein
MTRTQPTVYSVKRVGTSSVLAIDEVWAQREANPLSANYRHLFAMIVDDRTILIGIDAATHTASAFHVQFGEEWITPIASHLELGGPWDLVAPFMIGNIPHLLTYFSSPTSSDTRQFAFYPLDSHLRARPPYSYRRTRPPGITSEFTVVQPITVRGAVYYLCYGFDTGRVLIYSLAVTAQSPDGRPPLVSQVACEQHWAPKWTRFAFFQLGGSTYFLKTNVGRLNVNIDKVHDAPSEGAIQIASRLRLDDALALDLIRSFYVERCEPYFLTYKKDGTTNFNRFHPDLKSWTTEATTTCLANATQIVPMQSDSGIYVLFY